MKALLAEDTLPVAEFKTHASQVINRLKENGRPVLITQHGRAAAVLIPAAEYDRLYERELFIAKVQHALAEVEAGHVLEEEEVFAALEAEFGPIEDP